MQTKSILKWSLILSIVIILNLFFNFAISTVYKAPQYEDFCKREQVNIAPATQEACVAVGGAWNENTGIIEPVKTGPKGYCDVTFTCQKEYTDTNKVYNRNVFIALVVLGLASLGAGVLLATGSSAVSLGLSLGGVLSFIVASVRYWADMDEYLRVIILGLALVALIFLAIKKFKD